MSKIQTVWVYADAAERYADLIAGARRFGAVVNAVVPCESCAAELRACGPAAVYNLGLAEGEAIENYAETIASLAQGEGNLFLFDATRRSKALAAGVAAKRGAGLVNDALSLEAGDAVKATFRTYGGLAAAAVRIVSADAVVTVGAGVFEPEPADASADIPVIAVEKVAPAAAIVVKERRAKAAASVDLTKAKRVIGIGRGIAKQEDIAMIEAFAKAIGAALPRLSAPKSAAPVRSPKASTGWNANAISVFPARSSKLTSTLRSAFPARFSIWSAPPTAA